MKKIKFIRNLETERNKEQEDSFERSMNFELFFSLEKEINKFDSWNFKNVKKLIDNIPIENEINIVFQSWNNNIEYAMKELNILNFELSYKLTDEEIEILKSDDVVKQFKFTEKISNQPNKQLAMLIFFVEELKNKHNATMILNVILNGGLGTLKDAITILFPLYINREKQ